jgi:hypothetical protein
VEETCRLLHRRRKLRGRRSHPVTERGTGTMGNDAVFALAVGQVVWCWDTAPWSKHRIPPLRLSCFLIHAAGHRRGVAMDGLGMRNTLGAMVFLRVTAGKAAP